MSVFFRSITTPFFKRMLSDEFIFYLGYTRVDQTFSNSRNTNLNAGKKKKKTGSQLYQEILEKVFCIINNMNYL